MTEDSSPTVARHDAWTAFGIGALGGVIGGLSLLTFAGILAISLIALFGGIGLHPRPFGAAGTLIGWAATWLITLGAAQARCDPASCVGPDLTPWVTFAVALAVIGASLLVLGIRQPAWARRTAIVGGAWLSRRPVRIATAVMVGALAGVYAASLLVVGWLTAVMLALWFAWRHRSASRRQEIAWLGLGAIGAFAMIGPR